MLEAVLDSLIQKSTDLHDLGIVAVANLGPSQNWISRFAPGSSFSQASRG